MSDVLDDFTIPRGIAYFDRFDASGNLSGEADLGNTPGFTVSAQASNLEHFSSRGGLAEKDRDVPTQINRSATMTIDNLSMQNMAFFIIGGVSNIVQAGTAVTGEAITVHTDRWYQLGRSTNGTGVRNVSTVVVQDVTDTTTYAAGSDYLLDNVTGRIKIVSGGAISDDDVIHVGYTPAAETRQQVQTQTAPVRGALRVVADNPEGSNKDYFFPSVTLRPSGEVPVLTPGDQNQWAQMQFDVGINKLNAATPAIYIDGRAIA